jgi:hypothetical protein
MKRDEFCKCRIRNTVRDCKEQAVVSITADVLVPKGLRACALTIVGGVRESRWCRRGCGQRVCTRGSKRALLGDPSTSPLAAGSKFMRKRLFMLTLLAATCGAAPADSLKATFGGGVLGIPWGATLTNVAGIYPEGDHVFAVTPGCRAYWVKDGQQFLGIPREGKGVLFGMDSQNHVAIAAIAFDFDRRAELHGTLISLFGAPMLATQSGGMTRYGWRSSEGMTASVTEFGEGTQRIIWLTVSVSGYKAEKQACLGEPAANNRWRGP